MGTTDTLEKLTVFFDGHCNLCNSSVQFIIKKDSKSKIAFASLQSEFARKSLPEAFTAHKNLNSIVLLEGDIIKTKSSAVISLARYLNKLWPFFYLFILIPTPIRDFIYDFIAANRYKWFGKKDECMIPSPELKDRFYD